MRRLPRHVLRAAAIALVAGGIVACGDDPADVARRTLGPDDPTTATTSTAPASRDEVDEGRPVSARAARRALLRAARRSTAGPRQFDIRLESVVEPDRQAPARPGAALAGATTVSVRLAGRSDEAGNTEASGSVSAGPLHRDISARIVGDRLYVLRAGRWFDIGSAGGITLDVGRELFAHGSLVQVRGGRRMADGRLVIRGSATPAGIASQARSEPTGLVPTFLQYTDGVRFVAVLRDGELVANELRASVRLPSRAARVTGVRAAGMRIRERSSAAGAGPAIIAPANPRRARSLAELLFGGAGQPAPR